jgi:hypothetical protein
MVEISLKEHARSTKDAGSKLHKTKQLNINVTEICSNLANCREWQRPSSRYVQRKQRP